MPPANSGQQLDLDDGYAPSDETVLINALSYFSSALIGTQEKPFSHGLFDMDRGTVAARMVWLKISFMAVVLLIFIILGILSIYWAALGRSFGNIHKLSGYVVVSTFELATHSALGVRLQACYRISTGGRLARQ